MTTLGSGKNSQISIMLVDDSAVIRGGLTRILEPQQDINIVASVSNGEQAINSALKYKPDIILLDIEMPVMDGLTALPLLLKTHPQAKVIMFSSLTEKGADVSIKAMSLGAVECIVKPSAQSGAGSEFQTRLLETIRGLCAPTEVQSKIADPVSSAPQPANQRPLGAPSDQKTQIPKLYEGRVTSSKPSVIAIGSSTGGPQALFEVIGNLKGISQPILITQHMPATFTKILARHIEQNTGLTSFEGEDGMPVKNGQVYVAPGGKHMVFEKKGLDLVIHLDDRPPVNFCKPAVDVMFNSLIDLYGNKVLGVILTGMGNDGLGAGKSLASHGGRLIAQDKATSVVWGMPGAVSEAGICHKILPLKEIGPWIKSQT